MQLNSSIKGVLFFIFLNAFSILNLHSLDSLSLLNGQTDFFFHTQTQPLDTLYYGESFQAIPVTAPWIVEAQQVAFHTKKEEQMHPALKGFLRFLIVSVGALPLTVGLSSLVYLYPPPGWSVSNQTAFALITGTSLAFTVGFIDLIIDAILQNQPKKV